MAHKKPGYICGKCKTQVSITDINVLKNITYSKDDRYTICGTHRNYTTKIASLCCDCWNDLHVNIQNFLASDI